MTSAPQVRELMQPEVATLRENDELSLADDVMRLGRIRHLPILDDDDRLVGIVSQRDLFRGALARAIGYGDFAQRKLMKMLRVKEVMSTPVETVTPETPLDEAARRMLTGKLGCLVVVEGGRVAGILTESDFVRRVSTSG